MNSIKLQRTATRTAWAAFWCWVFAVAVNYWAGNWATVASSTLCALTMLVWIATLRYRHQEAQSNAVARLVMRDWIAMMVVAAREDERWNACAPPFAAVARALHGESSPAELGVDPESETAQKIRELTAR